MTGENGFPLGVCPPRVRVLGAYTSLMAYLSPVYLQHVQGLSVSVLFVYLCRQLILQKI